MDHENLILTHWTNQKPSHLLDYIILSQNCQNSSNSLRHLWVFTERRMPHHADVMNVACRKSISEYFYFVYRVEVKAESGIVTRKYQLPD